MQRPAPQPVRYDWQLLDAGPLLLDAGGMFGLIPKVVWSRSVETDDKNRVALRHNALLLRGGGRTILIETGSGNKLDEKMTRVFGLSSRTAESAVTDAGVDPEEVAAVVVTHLHFDHAGGLTRRLRAGEDPDWTATAPHQSSGDADAVKLTFPNAQVIAQRREWTDALNNTSVMTRTYFPDHLLPLEKPLNADGRERLRLIDSPIPFPADHAPLRDERPKALLQNRATEVLPGVRVFLTPGHTWGQQCVLFEDTAGRTVVFTSDVLPTHWHAGQAYSLAYDVEPYTSMVSKGWLLAEAAANNWLLVLDHDPETPLVTVEPDGKGWFTLLPSQA
ncbi:MAG: MBL fold metallo-hydrolase [Planctomycetota bacterium]